ncbi:MAG: ABC transporter ATP-binding protein [Anaerolineales bacterium]|nr:ABC transporter ATP-binding protein [Anaerolineales bacterium]
MSEISIKVENISKMYNIGLAQQRHDTLRDQIVDLISAPFRRSGKDREEGIFWALRDVSFEVMRGEVLGIIGRNGAGKSTLLKLLSRITEPTSGRAVINGRVGSLLEVGTGFHPELTGRENVFLNGAILGMHRTEITRKFDEIVAFAEIDQFLDTPVKRYSSGMYVRLAFAVAAHLEPEILLVDEVLAVGDVEFQKKCLGKMDDVAKLGRTVLFVSHNMNAIQRLCSQTIFVDKGVLVEKGLTRDVVSGYISSNFYSTAPKEWISLDDSDRVGTGEAYFDSISYESPSEEIGYKPYSNGPVEFSLFIESDASRSVSSMAVTIFDQYGTKLVNADSVSLGNAVELKKGRNHFKFRINHLHLNPGVYVVGLWLAKSSGNVLDQIYSAIRIDVVDLEEREFGMRIDGAVTCDFKLVADEV